MLLLHIDNNDLNNSHVYFFSLWQSKRLQANRQLQGFQDQVFLFHCFAALDTWLPTQTWDSDSVPLHTPSRQQKGMPWKLHN